VIKELPQSEKGLHNGAMVRSEEEAGALPMEAPQTPGKNMNFHNSRHWMKSTIALATEMRRGTEPPLGKDFDDNVEAHESTCDPKPTG
jgi:hypothetical protein